MSPQHNQSSTTTPIEIHYDFDQIFSESLTDKQKMIVAGNGIVVNSEALSRPDLGDVAVEVCLDLLTSKDRTLKNRRFEAMMDLDAQRWVFKANMEFLARQRIDNPSEPKVILPPGSGLLDLMKNTTSPKNLEQIYMPLVQAWREEFFEEYDQRDGDMPKLRIFALYATLYFEVGSCVFVMLKEKFLDKFR